jgi:hypothetical protein
MGRLVSYLKFFTWRKVALADVDEGGKETKIAGAWQQVNTRNWVEKKSRSCESG